MPLDLDGDQLVVSTSSAGLDLFDDARDLCSQAAMMSDEETCAQSFAQAAETLIKAYQVGMFEAAQVLGILYYERHVQAADADAQAFLWFGRGCEHGPAFRAGIRAHALHAVLGEAQLLAQSTRAQAHHAADADAQAFLWFGRGCEHGLADCACYLGDMLRDGRSYHR